MAKNKHPRHEEGRIDTDRVAEQLSEDRSVDTRVAEAALSAVTGGPVEVQAAEKNYKEGDFKGVTESEYQAPSLPTSTEGVSSTADAVQLPSSGNARHVNINSPGEHAKMQVQLRRLEHAKDLPLPYYQTNGSAGFDLVIAESVTIEPGRIAVVKTGFAYAIPAGYYGQVRPRSGLASKGLTMSSSGVVDSDYRGEVMVPIVNLTLVTHTLNRGERVAQMLILPVRQVDLVEVERLPETARGAGGFGHTGRV